MGIRTNCKTLRSNALLALAQQTALWFEIFIFVNMYRTHTETYTEVCMIEITESQQSEPTKDVFIKQYFNK